jgi:hypothetical protein
VHRSCFRANIHPAALQSNDEKVPASAAIVNLVIAISWEDDSQTCGRAARTLRRTNAVVH